ncbi:cytochrome P450 [Athelia psychrophila]|uniref:Cytochrome P450 n=1 Tax=Athelia psychrophila TaxID=1759441 RepID=A0A166HLK2_9AGAM|nr:cytochrome P450 [Fibularhizoctonia sp. CBS 109695]
MSVSVDTSTLALLTSLLLATLYYSLFRKASRYPPGPKGWPIIGNLLDAPRPGSPWIEYHAMCKKYNSDMVYLRILGQSILVLDSFEAINDLLEKRSNINSSRPRFTMPVELMGWAGNFTFMPYGNSWRAHRRLFQSEFNTRGISSHHQQQTQGAHGLLSRLLERPQQWHDDLRHHIGAAILDVAYGIKPLPEHDPIIDMVEGVMSVILPALAPGKFLVEILPWLKYVPAWVPGASFQDVARESNAKLKTMISTPFQQVKRAMVDGTANPSFTANRLQDIDLNGDVPYQESIIEESAAVIFAAGADTTMSTLSTFILAMMKHPEVQAKAQLELDTVLGAGRLPSFGDEDSLPYISAVVKECLRWEVATPFAIPHLSTEDDLYRGFYIPAGTMVIPNSWAVLNDERMYPDPFVFNPDRFITGDKLDPSVRDPDAAFGYGRRICPGQHMAQGTIWLNVGCILACFNIEKPVDKHGNVFEPSVKYISGILRHPEPFACRIEPRSKDVEDMIRALSA